MSTNKIVKHLERLAIAAHRRGIGWSQFWTEHGMEARDCDPGDISAFGVAYLNGQSTPTIENGQQEPDILGIYWRAFFDFAVCQIDPRGAVFSKGAA